jgi:hypothetical protein
VCPAPDALEFVLPFLLGPAPCDQCRYRRRCGSDLLACEAYSLYARESTSKQWDVVPRAPTRARYLAVFHDKTGDIDGPRLRELGRF